MIFDINYCEQPIINGYLQPFNTISNLFFIMVAIFLYYFYKSNKIKDVKSKLFLYLIVLIGIGSFLWHLRENSITYFSDAIPVILFFIAYIYFLILHLIKSKRTRIYVIVIYSILITLLWIILRFAIKDSIIIMNEAYGYFLVLLSFIIILIYTYIKKRHIFRKIMVFFLLFLSAFVFRQIDLLVCPYFIFGTHFIWHFFTAIAAYFAVRFLYE